MIAELRDCCKRALASGTHQTPELYFMRELERAARFRQFKNSVMDKTADRMEFAANYWLARLRARQEAAATAPPREPG